MHKEGSSKRRSKDVQGSPKLSSCGAELSGSNPNKLKIGSSKPSVIDERSRDDCRESWCRFLRDRRWGRKSKARLLVHFGDPLSVFAAQDAELRAVAKRRRPLENVQVPSQAIEQDLAFLQVQGQHLITIFDDRYPLALKQLPDPPLALFARGDLSLLEKPKVAIVGSRRPTPVGMSVASKIAADLSALGIVINSGMALGIDGIAHTAALNAAGDSIAVLGGGLDVIYPRRHRQLYQQLGERGLLLSEFPLGMQPDRHTFPLRNRIVSGLSLGVIIVEAAERSGTLITARLAAEQNREVMVVPGSALSKQYQGSHRLLQDGAALVSCAEDVLACLSLPLKASLDMRPSVTSANRDADTSAAVTLQAGGLNKVLEHIGAEPTSVDDVILGSGLTAAEVSSILLELELIGAVTVAVDGGYVNLS